MAFVRDIQGDSKYVVVHEHGFVGLVDHMGDDAAICQAARVSYGAGTKSVSDDRGLIRYLLRHHHTSPLEMCEVKLHMKLPIFVARQLVRHRTANINEYSGRYSEMPDEFYIPSFEDMQPQSKTNNQGRSGEISDRNKGVLKSILEQTFVYGYQIYQGILSPFNSQNLPDGWAWDEKAHVGLDEGLDEEYQGLAKELSRIVLPVANYTEWYWKIDLHNLFHFLKLRLDPHAQKEIRDFSEAIYKLVQPLYPVAFEAFEDYSRQSKTLSRMEIILIKELVRSGYHSSEKSFVINRAKDLGMSKREIDEFVEFWIS